MPHPFPQRSYALRLRFEKGLPAVHPGCTLSALFPAHALHTVPGPVRIARDVTRDRPGGNLTEGDRYERDHDQYQTERN